MPPLLHKPHLAALVEAARALREGQLVVFPTETVYGVGADALNPAAVAKIYEVKGRPADNPLIVHLASAAQARELARTWPAEADRLARAFWPGPLTLVVPRAASVPDAPTAGLDSIALRVPSHPVARALLQEARLPVAAPSANRSGRPSPTRAVDAAADLGDAVAIYLDGGPTSLGVESTVVSLLGSRPELLRPGGLPLEALEAVAGTIIVSPHAGPARSPGQRHRHYAPRAVVHIVEGKKEALEAAASKLESSGRRVAVLASTEHAPEGPHVRVVGPRNDGAAWSRQLFSLLRDLDAEGYDALVVEAIPELGLGRAVMDRLRRAAQGGPEPGGT